MTSNIMTLLRTLAYQSITEHRAVELSLTHTLLLNVYSGRSVNPVGPPRPIACGNVESGRATGFDPAALPDDLHDLVDRQVRTQHGLCTIVN